MQRNAGHSAKYYETVELILVASLMFPYVFDRKHSINDYLLATEHNKTLLTQTLFTELKMSHCSVSWALVSEYYRWFEINVLSHGATHENIRTQPRLEVSPCMGDFFPGHISCHLRLQLRNSCKMAGVASGILQRELTLPTRGLKYGLLGTITVKNLRKYRVSPSDGAYNVTLCI